MPVDGWVGVRLGEICTKIGSGATPRGGASVYLDVGRIALVRSQNVYNDGFRRHGLAYITEEHAEQLGNVEVQPGDVLLNITGDSVARCCQVDSSILPARVNQHVSIIRPNPEHLDGRLLRYILVSPDMQSLLLSWAGAGGTRNALTKSMIESLAIYVPKDVGEQRAIAHILGTLDDKIELNRRMSETLEAMARAIFQSWFVDFDPVRAKAEGRQLAGLAPEIADLFPDGFEPSEMGQIPSGWQVARLGDLIELAYGKALRDPDRRSGSVPVFGSNGQVGWHDEALVPGPGIVVGRKGNPGVVTWAPADFFCIDTTFYVVLRERTAGLHFFYYALRNQNLESLAADSAVPGLNRNLAYMSMQLVPPPRLTAVFESVVQSLFVSLDAGDRETRTLALLRDTLLPKLISGELRVPDAERFLEENS